MRFAKLALPVPLGQAFTYSVPADIVLTPGARALVQLRNRPTLGVVIETEASPPELPPEKIKPILSVLPGEPVLSEELLSFVLELSRYYLAPVGEALRLALPALLRGEAEAVEEKTGKKWSATGRLVQVAELTQEGSLALSAAGDTGAIKAKDLAFLKALKSGPRSLSGLTAELGSARAVAGRLQERGYVSIQKELKEIDPFFSEAITRDQPKHLNQEQERALVQILAALDERKQSTRPDSARFASKSAFLLDGVTASGKTEVYLQAAAHALSLGKGVILLVPEIALTPQLVARFRARLGDEIAVLHSGLREGARRAMWQNLRDGRVRVAIGARSALFSPVQNLGLICVDEEHDSSYKQEEGVRYHARDMALLRAHRASAVCVLGSATPSLASELACRRGQLERLRLSQRAHASALLPKVSTIDLTKMGPGPSGDPLLSLPLHRAIEENLRARGQTILFLNRRGFSPSLVCGDCGTIQTCPNCSVALTLHRSGRPRLECHYCDLRITDFSKCGACSSPHLTEEGAGTERIEALLKDTFKDARIARLDRDVAGGTKSEKILAQMRRGEIDILVGTQMVTKGHDLPEVTLVGVLNADAALSMPDFRAAERTFQLLVQVAGRAGRKDREGRVLIQTRNPSHPAIAAAVNMDVRSFLEGELESRREVGYPPLCHLALVKIEGPDETLVRSEAMRLARLIPSENGGIETIGPAPAPIAKIKNRYRYRFLLRGPERTPIRTALLKVLRDGGNRRVRLTVDIDPISLL